VKGTGPHGRADSNAPDVLFVVLDTLTADAAGLGRSTARMPFLDSLAARGIVAPRAVANAPWTLPSHVSMFTGLLPCEHRIDTTRALLLMEAGDGLRDELRGLPSPVRDPFVRERLLAARLRAAGYRTIAASNNPWVGRLTGLDHGFDAIRDTASIRVSRIRGALRGLPAARSHVRAGVAAFQAIRGGADLFGALTARVASERIRREDRDRPLFAFVNLIEAHAPYLSPGSRSALRDAGASWRRTRAAMELAEPRAVLGYNLAGQRPRGEAASHGIQRALHREAGRYLDALLGELHAAARSRGRPLVTVVTSDHGESFGEDGATSHGFVLSEPALRVPLVVAGDGIDAAEQAGPVDLRTVWSTILAVAGVARDRDHERVPAPLFEQRAEDDVAVAQRDGRVLPSWLGSVGQPGAERSARMSAVLRGRWKLVTLGGERRLFDLSLDPAERDDVSGSNPDVVVQLSAFDPPWPEAADRAGDDRDAARHGDGGDGALNERDEAAVTERLRALGYVE
jgi:arylsulfatase A-like enzyme